MANPRFAVVRCGLGRIRSRQLQPPGNLRAQTSAGFSAPVRGTAEAADSNCQFISMPSQFLQNTMKHLAISRLINSHRVAAMIAVLLAGPVFAAKEAPAVPDLTQGGKLAEKNQHDWNLGPTGLRGKMWAWSMVTTEARQILVTKVDKGSPAAGLVQVDDVILGVGTSKFTSDARVAFGNAITTAETKAAGGKLPLLLWRKGKELAVTVPLRVMGSYGPQWPFGSCEKSAKIIELGTAHLAKNIGPSIPDQIGALALLATGDKKFLPLVADLAHKVGPKDFKIDESDRGMVGWN